SNEAGNAAWVKLKGILKDRNLSLSSGPSACYRTKAGCLRVCQGGPILVVYPEGYWYGGMTEDRIERFVEEQLVQGKPIHEWIFAKNPLHLEEKL
ncbi:MAG: (2Fe-2S) ferredoxin domain-containing protein, partial [Pirellula sp.]